MARILIVDDSDVIRGLLTEFLGELGHQIESAVDGREGLKMAADGGYDLCICDVHLPKLNGYQLLTELGENRGRMPFIFTDSMPDELADQIQESSGFLCLRKPFDLDQLKKTVSEALGKIRA